MKGSGYWRERYIKLGERMSAKGEGYYKALQGEYEKAFESIEKDIQSFYNRFAADNKLTYAEASKLLTSSERKKFQMSVDEYIKKGAANGVSLDWTRELRNASGVYHISRLKALQMQIQNEIETIAAKKLKGMGGLFEDAYREGYYRSLYELQKGMGHGAAFSTLDTRRIETAMGMVYGEDGLNFSERIWKDRRALAQTLKTEFPQMIIRGENPEKLVKLLSDKFEVSKAAARRLIRTESAFLSSYAAKESFEETGVKEFEVVVALDGRTCQSACAPLDGMHRPLSEYEIWVTAPPFHHNCRCVAVPYFNDEFTEGEERAARDTETGKTYYVPSDMTYKEWYNKHVAPKVLTLEEEGAIMRYISSGSYIINEALRNGQPLEGFAEETVENLDSALRKMPFYYGDVIRSVKLEFAEEIQAYIDRFKVGETILEKQYISTTKGGVYNTKAKVQIYIQNSSKGRDLSGFNFSEKEILYERGAEFKVMHKENVNGIWWIVLEEY